MVVQKNPKSDVSRCLDTSSTTQNGPKSWSNIEDPVVPLEPILYGHPFAGLWWARQFEEVLLGLGWERLPNWECLFVHRQQE